jgi:hypothetical protein
MAFDGSAIKALLDGAVAKGTLHGVAAVVVDSNGPVFPPQPARRTSARCSATHR